MEKKVLDYLPTFEFFLKIIYIYFYSNYFSSKLLNCSQSNEENNDYLLGTYLRYIFFKKDVYKISTQKRKTKNLQNLPLG